MGGLCFIAFYNTLIINTLQRKWGGVNFSCIYEKKAVPLQQITEEAEKPMKSRQEMNYKKE